MEAPHDTVTHPENDTPIASDAGIKRMDAHTLFHPVSESIQSRAVGENCKGLPANAQG